METTNPKRIVAMASFPPRKAGMLLVVKTLLPQCDVLHLYLNGYTTRPEELPDDPRLDVVLAGPGCVNIDLGSHGKFFWVGKEEGYYLTVDDDILYPDGYVSSLVAAVEKYGRKAIVGYHGSLYKVPPGGAFPKHGFAKNLRTLLPYDRESPKDTPVHCLGAGVMASYPTAIGLAYDKCRWELGSGDDEDIAIWAQQNRVPSIKLKGRKDWIRPNNTQWIIDPLHRRTDYIKTSDAKLRRWGQWKLVPIPNVPGLVTEPVVNRLAMPVTVPRVPQRRTPLPPARLNLLRPMPKVQAPRTSPQIVVKTTIPSPTGPSFDKVLLTDGDYAFTDKILSSDALAAQLVTRIKQRIPTSVIRMSDGERAIIEYSRTGKKEGFLVDPVWLRKYGLVGVDLTQVGKDLLWAGETADYLACTISGVFWNTFRVHPLFPNRDRFIDQFYWTLMEATDRIGAILRAGPVLVLHREHARIAQNLRQTYGQTQIAGLTLDSCQDHPGLIDAVKGRPETTVLVSGGAGGKPFCVRLANETGKVVLDAGESLTKHIR